MGSGAKDPVSKIPSRSSPSYAAISTQVALRLLDSLDAPDPHAHLTDDELRAELERRVKAVVDGTAEVIPADQVIEQLRAELKK